MSKLLFCTTDAKDFVEDCYNPSFNYQNNGFLALKPDYYGLQSWEEFVPLFDQYDLIWLHLNPRKMLPYWYDFPRLIKFKAPDVPMIISHEYLLKYYNEPLPFMIKRALEYGDYLQCNNKIAKELFEELVDVPMLYLHAGQPVSDTTEWLEPLPWSLREGVVLIEHSVFTPLVESFEMIQRAGLSATLMTANHVHDASFWDHYVDAYGVDARCYGRLPHREYLDRIRECRVGLEYGYVGVSRFSFECAREGVPVIGSNIYEYRTMLYPKLTVSSVKEGARVLKRIHNRKWEPKDLNKPAQKLIAEYWNMETCINRVKEALEGIGVSV